MPSVVGRFQPATPVRYGVFLRDAAQQQNRLGQDQLGHRAGVGVRGVKHHNAFFLRGDQIHLVGANAKAANAHQLFRRLQHLARQLGARTHADKMHIGNLGLELIALQRVREQLHIAVTSLGKGLHSTAVNPFQEQNFDFRFVQRGFCHEDTFQS